MGDKVKKTKKDSKFIKLFDVCENDEGKLYLRANNYKGRLVWQQFGGEDGDDLENSTLYLVKTASLFPPHEKAPEYIKDVVSVNLKNENAVEVIED